MGVIGSLSQMHRDASEQIRAGDHSAFLVGFLTTSTLLEISGLATCDLRLDEFAIAAAETIALYTPVDRVRIRLVPDEFAPIVASVGMRTGRDAKADATDDATTSDDRGLDSSQELADDDDLAEAATVHIEGAGRVVVSTVDLLAPLAASNFLEIAAQHVASGFQHLLEDERRRRKAAVADTLALVASLNEHWGQTELDGLAQALATLPGAHAARLDIGANRLAGVLTATAGTLSGEITERSFTIDERVQAEVFMAFRVVPTPEQLHVLDDILVTLAANLSRIEQNIRLTSEAETDQLTGVANRRRVGKSLAATRAMSDRRNEPFAVLLFDLDHFKAVNDQLGHIVGDGVLHRFAQLLTRNVRPFDTVARWGGEEFMLLCPDCDVNGAIAIGQRVLEQCPQSFGDVLPPEIAQTTSIGIAVYPEHGRTPESVINAADEALYRSKREGRNRWSAAGNIAAKV